uniref:CLN6 transmembrane ER protein n=1 Tax=Ovis aries TaxID=9940 RepID=A0AC11BL14_SHEEP
MEAAARRRHPGAAGGSGAQPGASFLQASWCSLSSGFRSTSPAWGTTSTWPTTSSRPSSCSRSTPLSCSTTTMSTWATPCGTSPSSLSSSCTSAAALLPPKLRAQCQGQPCSWWCPAACTTGTWSPRARSSSSSSSPPLPCWPSSCTRSGSASSSTATASSSSTPSPSPSCSWRSGSPGCGMTPSSGRSTRASSMSPSPGPSTPSTSAANTESWAQAPGALWVGDGWMRVSVGSVCVCAPTGDGRPKVSECAECVCGVCVCVRQCVQTKSWPRPSRARWSRAFSLSLPRAVSSSWVSPGSRRGEAWVGQRLGGNLACPYRPAHPSDHLTLRPGHRGSVNLLCTHLQCTPFPGPCSQQTGRRVPSRLWAGCRLLSGQPWEG